MARVSTYLNFPGNAAEAFDFYRSVFGTDYQGPVMRMGDVPSDPGGPGLSEAERLYAALSEGATDWMPLTEMFWGALWGTCLDRFGVRWMFNYELQQPSQA